MKQFSDNIMRTKKESKKWAKVYNAKQQVKLKEVEAKLKGIYNLNRFGTFSEGRIEGCKRMGIKAGRFTNKRRRTVDIKKKCHMD